MDKYIISESFEIKSCADSDEVKNSRATLATGRCLSVTERVLAQARVNRASEETGKKESHNAKDGDSNPLSPFVIKMSTFYVFAPQRRGNSGDGFVLSSSWIPIYK